MTVVIRDGKRIMAPDDPQWKKFISLLEGPEGCNFQMGGDPSDATWTCDATSDRPLAKKILATHFPEYDVDASLEYFEHRGGYCDCEIVFNVENCTYEDFDTLEDEL